MLKLRASCDAEELNRQSDVIRERLLTKAVYQQCESLFCYVSFRNEVDTHKIIKQAFLDGKNVAVPRVEGNKMHFYRIASLQELKKSRFGILEPTDEAQKVTPVRGDLMIVPGAAFDRDGYRIGYGGGYYDRYLDNYRDLYTLGLAFDFQMTDRLPRDAYDLAVREVIHP